MWIITGVFNLVAMLLLQDFLKRDLQNIVSAKKYIKDQADRDLIVSSQLFAGLSSEGNDVDFLVRRIVFVTLCFLPFIFHTLVLLTDIFPVDQIITSVGLLEDCLPQMPCRRAVVEARANIVNERNLSTPACHRKRAVSIDRCHVPQAFDRRLLIARSGPTRAACDCGLP
jgi:hypothetical protein